MADIFQDEFLNAELADIENFLFASGDDEGIGIEDENKNEDKETDEQSEENSSEINVESVISQPKIPTLEELANSDFIRNRQLAAKSIVEYLNQAGGNKEALYSVISIMSKLSEDEDLMVRSELMEHIPSIAMFCKEHSEDLGVVIRQQIVPYTVKLLTDCTVPVRKIGHTTLLVLLENDIIDNSQLSEWICPLIAQLATSESTPEQLQCEDVSVMCKMISYVGKEITEKFFMEPFLSLCCDSSTSIKEICMLHFGNLCKVVGRETTESILLPLFLEFTQDTLTYRRCVDIAVDFATVVSPSTRIEVLAPLYINFLKSDIRHVWQAAHMSLGRFISTFADPSRTGLCYKDGIWTSFPFEDECTEDQKSNDFNFDYINSQIISNPQFNECSFKNLNNCLTNNYSFDSQSMNNQSTKYILSQHSPKSPHVKIEEQLYSNSEVTNVQNSVNYEKIVNNPSLTLPPKDSHLYLHVENENVFNNFQFWRTPLPEVELDLETDTNESKSENINITSKEQNETDTSQTSSSTLYLTSPKQATVNTTISLSEEKIVEIEDVKCDTSHFFDLLEVLVFRDSYEIPPRWRRINSATDKGKSHMNVYDQDIVPPELLMEFVKELPIQEDLKTSIAYYFPSVAYTLGGKYWPCLRNAFNCLANDFEFSVRKSVASSLHELALILGRDITRDDLLPVFLDMFKDEKLRAVLLKHVSQFLRNLSPYHRRQFLPLLQGLCVWEEDSNWRYRHTVAEQLIPCLELYTPSEALHFFPVSLVLLQDKVSAVRRSAVELLAVIIKSLGMNSKSSEFLKAALLALDEKYRKANKWLWRQMYVYICQELAVKSSLPTDFYVNHIIPNLFSLAYDTVPNVRLAVARCLGLALLPLDFLPSIQKAHYQLLLQVMYSLQSDVDRDVRYFAHLSATSFNVLPPKKLSPA